MTGVFITRLLLYFIAALIPFVHPAVAVTYDSISRWVYLVLVPAEMVIAFLLRPPWMNRFLSVLIALIPPALSVVFISGFGQTGIFFFIASVISYGLTALIFARGTRFTFLSTVEVFIPAIVYYRLLAFARSSEEAAMQNSSMTVLVFIVLIFSILAHFLTLYKAAYPDRISRKKRNELFAFILISVPMGIMLYLFLPVDFVKHTRVLNELGKEPPPSPQELGEGREKGGGEGDEGNTRNGKPLGERENQYPSQLSKNDGSSGQGEGRGGSGVGGGQPAHNSLEGIPAKQWNNRSRMAEGGTGKQSAVMVVGSPVDPVYASEYYWGDFDKERGFLITKDEPLNSLTHMRLVETYEPGKTEFDNGRKEFKIFYFSTIPERALAYRPVLIEPTVQHIRYHPFDLSYNAISAMSATGPEQWKKIEGLSPLERSRLSPYLIVNMAPDRTERLKRYANRLVAGRNGYFEKIDTILRSYKQYQYEMGFDEDTSLKKIETFMFETKTGDCTEFAHTAALLGRLVGIPSRVVTGYIATKDLQTPAHIRGLMELRNRIKPLQQFPLEELYLVTTSHHHAWVQYYMPGYGWIDFETTSFAKPPKPQFDPNNMDVLIPLVEEEYVPPAKRFEIPYLLIGRAIGILIVVALVAVYTFRDVKIYYLMLVSLRNDRRGLDALFRLLFIRLAMNGYPLKPPSRTTLEYSREYPELENFASVHTMLRFREHYAVGEKEIAWKELRKTYRQAIRETKKKGLLGMMRRRVSLRGLYY